MPENAGKPAKTTKIKPSTPQTTISQPNSVTFAHSRFSRTQIHIFAYVMKELQGFVIPQLGALKARDMSTLQTVQLNLFTEVGDSFLVDIPKKIFVKSSNYKRFKEELQALSTLPITYLKRHPKTGKPSEYLTNMFSIYNELDASGSRSITLEIKKDTLQVLCMISTTSEPKDALYYLDYYTNYTFEILTSFTKKYTSLLYLYLSSWKSKGGWQIPTNQLREYLGVPEGKYEADKDLKKHVLNVARDEMKEKQSPIWFEADIVGKYTVFKIITPERNESNETHKNSIIDLLRKFRCSDAQIDEIRHFLVEEYFPKIRDIITGCYDAIMDSERDSRVNDPAAYVIGALKKWYSNRRKKIG